MKFLMLSVLIGTTAWAAETTTMETAATTPKQACEALAKAAIDNNYKAFTDLTMMPMGHDGKPCPKGKKGKKHGECMAHSEEGFQKMHDKEMARLKSISCKEEKVAGEHAWVEATSQSETRLVPFKMVDGKWKFDMKTYHTFYHGPMNHMMMKK